MKRTKEMYGGCYYLLEGKATANTAFIETAKDAKLFINLCNTYLGPFMKIHEYLLTKDGWLLQVSLNEKARLFSTFATSQGDGIRKKEIFKSDETWRIISERIRQMLSIYVRRTNKRYKREGTKVKHNYRRYYFSTSKEAGACMKSMQKQELNLRQRKKKYRPVKGHYRIGKKLGKGHIFLCSRRVRRDKRVRELKMDCLHLLTLNQLVALKIVENTQKSHISNFKNQNTS